MKLNRSALLFSKPDKFSLVVTTIALLLVASTLAWLIVSKKPLGVGGDWAITPREMWPPAAWGLPLAALFIFGGLAAISVYDFLKRAKNRREQIASTRLALTGLFLLALVWPWTLIGPGGSSNIVYSQWSDISNQYFGTAYEIEDVRRFSAEYAATRQSPPAVALAHVATHPPGAVLSYYFARRVYERSPLLQNVFESLAVSLTRESLDEIATTANTIRERAQRSAGVNKPTFRLPRSAVGEAFWCAFLISLFLALATPGVYLIASASHRAQNTSEQSTPDAPQWINNQTRGLLAASLWALCPTANLFAYTLDAVIACGAVWTLALLAQRLRGGNFWWSIASGAVLALTSFVSFGALATGAIALFMAAFFLDFNRKAIVRELVIFAIGFCLMWLILILLFPMKPWVIFSQAMDAHRYATGGRNRLAWTFMNVVMFAVFCGWPVFVAALANFRKREESQTTDTDFPRAAWAMGVAGVLAVLLLTLSGKAMGEVERLWMFLAPAWCILAALTLMRAPNVPIIGTFIALQALQTLLMAAYLAPLVLPI